jgi:hypothetical protein
LQEQKQENKAKETETLWKPAFRHYFFCERWYSARSGVALDVGVLRDDVVEPVSGDIQHFAHGQHYLRGAGGRGGG